MSTNTNIQALLTDRKFIQCAKLNEIPKTANKLGNATKERFKVMLQIGKHCNLALDYFKSDEYKQKAKQYNVELTIKDLIFEVYGYKKSFFYDLAKISRIEQSKVDEYIGRIDIDKFADLSVKGLLKFANGNETDGEETDGEGETDVKTKEENLKIAVSKDNKITIKGKAKKEVLTLLIEELKRMLTEVETTNKKETKAA